VNGKDSSFSRMAKIGERIKIFKINTTISVDIIIFAVSNNVLKGITKKKKQGYSRFSSLK
jgi:hypothetical protein